MPGCRESSPELTAATDQAAALARDYLEDSNTPVDLVETAFCKCYEVLRAHGWTPENALAYCKRLVRVQAAAVGIPVGDDGPRWLTSSLVRWLLACYY